ncbi:alpha/beta-hydrolase [Hypoxylon sp. FL1150]|nr:alpha/beta-hydrolase [Hypoxylon sp. FL1150]
MSSSDLSVPAPFNSRHAVVIESITWSYLRARPSGHVKGTVLLLHGFPDLPYGWRNQVPIFTDLGYQVIVPYMLGYSQTSSPSELEQFAYKKQADGLAALLNQIVPGEQVILGGHDWGGNMTYRLAMYHGHLFRAIFTVCLSYFPPVTEYVDLAEEIAAGEHPTFAYRLQWRDPAFDRKFRSEAALRQFLTAVFGGQTPEGKVAFTFKGVDLEELPRLLPAPLLHGATLDRHASEIHERGFRGPLNWYRLDRINFEDELPIAEAGGHKFPMPALFIRALNEPFELSKDMDRHFDKLTKAEVNTNHWALIEDDGKEVNKILRSWIATLE